MEENKNQCIFCKKEFETARKKGCHQRLCELNPNREKMLKALRHGGSITFTKLNKARTLQRNEYKRNCEKCGTEYVVICTENNYIKGRYKKFCCRACANSRNLSDEQKHKISESLKKNNDVYCLDCGKKLFKKTKTGYCKKCVGAHKTFSTETLLKFRLAGLKSCSIQKETRRSKNEIEFCKLCEQKFENVKHNEPIFNGWDADVIIEDLKIAILWNGKWHYEKIAKNHSVEAVQNRDKIKIAEIEKCGYKPYVIKDLGSFDMDKVNEEFEKFLMINKIV